jgi:hypothetical protein
MQPHDASIHAQSDALYPTLCVPYRISGDCTRERVPWAKGFVAGGQGLGLGGARGSASPFECVDLSALSVPELAPAACDGHPRYRHKWRRGKRGQVRALKSGMGFRPVQSCESYPKTSREGSDNCSASVSGVCAAVRPLLSAWTRPRFLSRSLLRPHATDILGTATSGGVESADESAHSKGEPRSMPAAAPVAPCARPRAACGGGGSRAPRRAPKPAGGARVRPHEWDSIPTIRLRGGGKPLCWPSLQKAR